MQITSEITIKAPIEKVFDAFSDISKIGDRINGIDKIEILSDTKSGKGVRWRETRTMFGKEATEEMEMTEATAPTYYLVEAKSRGMHYKSTYNFEKVSDDETKVVLTFSGKALSLGAKLLTPLGALMKGSAKKAFEADMTDLKNYLEK